MKSWLQTLLSKFTEEPLSDKGSLSYEKEIQEQEGKAMWLFVGLGNPGAKYEKNRHNIGFMAVEAMADGAYNFPPFKTSKFKAEITEKNIDGTKVILMKPQTYMNESGQSVGAVARFYKISPENIVVLHDELDLKAGKLRIKKGGGNAGHNGLKSIQAHLSTPDFWRIRMGIGHPGEKHLVSNYVLSDFAKAEQNWLEQVIDFTTDIYGKIIENGAQSVTKDINSFKPV